MYISPASNMAKTPSNLPVLGYFPTAREPAPCCWDPPWVPQNKGWPTNQREIPKTPKKAVQLIANTEYPQKNNEPPENQLPFLCVCFIGLHIISRKTDRELLNSASSILLGDVGNVNAFCTTAIIWMFQTLTFFNCSCFLSRLAAHQIQANYIKLWGPQASNHDTQQNNENETIQHIFVGG